MGVKLGWGCLIFYPYFYLVTLWSTIDLDPANTPTWLLYCYALIFLSGWTLSRGANMQKYFFKTRPEKVFLGIKPKTITDGKRTLPVNGFWGARRMITIAAPPNMAIYGRNM